MFERITEFFIDIETGSVEQSEREALLDLLIWTMLVDGRIGYAENRRFDQVVQHLDWQAPLQISQYLGMSWSRIRTAVDTGTAEDELATSIARRLRSLQLRRRCLVLVEDVAASDGDLDEREKDLIETLERIFEAT